MLIRVYGMDTQHVAKLFAAAAFMALADSAFALTVPKPVSETHAEMRRGREIDENKRKVLK